MFLARTPLDRAHLKADVRPGQSLLRAVDEIYTQALREDGLLAGTMIATDDGWRPVDGVAKGDLVLTFDNGMQPVTGVHRLEIKRATVPAHKSFLMLVPANALGNRKDLLLMPSQEVIVESDRAEVDFGEPFVLVQTLMLDGYHGIRKVPMARDLQITMLTFENEQIIHASGAALIVCRAETDFCPLDASKRAHAVQTYNRLTHAQVKQVSKWLRQEAAYATPAALDVDDLYAAFDARLS
ncbi:MAG: Hint domain-containing protein [Roseinatronobacter sp.]